MDQKYDDKTIQSSTLELRLQHNRSKHEVPFEPLPLYLPLEEPKHDRKKDEKEDKQQDRGIWTIDI